MKISLNYLRAKIEGIENTPLDDITTAFSSIGHKVENVKRIGDEYILDLEINTNRCDCLNYHGLAREIATFFRKKLIPISYNEELKISRSNELINVVLNCPDFCPVYYAAIIRNISVSESPEWLKKLLSFSEINSINNLVDLSNYALLEIGQPLHIFDLDKIGNREIIVRMSRKNEKVITLEGKEVILPEGVGLITCSNDILALAGIVGAKNSSVTSETKNILIECAYFSPVKIRQASKMLGISTESSYRFERKIDPQMQEKAIKFIVSLILEQQPGAELQGIFKFGDLNIEEKVINFRQSYLKKIAGFDIPKETVIDIFEHLQFDILEDKDNEIKIKIPSFRQDIYEEIDLVEEVLRFYGFDAVPLESNLKLRKPVIKKEEVFKEKLDSLLTRRFFTQCYTNSFFYDLKKTFISIWQYQSPVYLVNREGQRNRVLRTSVIPGLLDTLQINESYGNKQLSIYEYGKVFFFYEDNLFEKKTLGLLTTDGFATIKGALEQIFKEIGLKNVSFVQRDFNFLMSKHSLEIILDDTDYVGFLGMIDSGISKYYNLSTAPWVCELDYELMLEKANFERRFIPFSRYPTVVRDLCILVNENICWETIRKIINENQISFLKNISVLDVYKGDKIPLGKKSITIRFTFQRYDRTLVKNEVDESLGKILDALTNLIGAELRQN